MFLFLHNYQTLKENTQILNKLRVHTEQHKNTQLRELVKEWVKTQNMSKKYLNYLIVLQ